MIVLTRSNGAKVAINIEEINYFHEDLDNNRVIIYLKNGLGLDVIEEFNTIFETIFKT